MMRAALHPVTIAAVLLCTALAHPRQAAAQARPYALDPVHTRVVFAVDHAGFSRAIGTVSGSTGTLLFDPRDWTTARLEVRVPLQRLDLGDEKWNRSTLARNLLDAERHPFAVFVSDAVEPLDENRANVHGTLTLRGVSNPLTLEVTLNALKRHPMPPFRRTAGFSATAMLQRSAFGIDAWPTMIGETVELRIEAEATRTARADPALPAEAGLDDDFDAVIDPARAADDGIDDDHAEPGEAADPHPPETLPDLPPIPAPQPEPEPEPIP